MSAKIPPMYPVPPAPPPPRLLCEDADFLWPIKFITTAFKKVFLEKKPKIYPKFGGSV